MPEHPSGLTSERITELRRHAARVAEHAYAPYSRFHVGAAVLLTTGDIVTGCNVENASFRLTTCAEQTAIVAAVAQHGPKIKLRAVVVVNSAGTACQPCGACRQTIFEFSTPETWVFYPAAEGALASLPIAGLLPAGFSLEPSA